MNKLLIVVCLALMVAACASTPTPSTPPGPVGAAAPARIAGCVPSNWPAPNGCKNVGAVYSQQDLQQTGVVGDTAQALRRLDSSVTVVH